MGGNPRATIRVLLADDHPLVLSGLRSVLGRESDLELVAAVTSGQQALEHARRLQPDVAVLDLQMPGMTGREATRHIRSACPRTRIVILSMQRERDDVAQALEAGAQGYVLKPSAPADVTAAVRAVHAGERSLGEGLRTRDGPKARPPGSRSSARASARSCAASSTGKPTRWRRASSACR